MARSEFQEGPATGHYHQGLGVDDQGQRLIGPFRIAHDTPGLQIDGDDPGIDTYPGALLCDIAAGTVLLRAWCSVVEAFGASAQVAIGTSQGPNSDGGADAFQLDEASFIGTKHKQLDGHAPNYNLLYTEDDGIYAVLPYDPGEPYTTGEADIYALILETPA